MKDHEQDVKAKRPVISNTTVLILSGFLIGLTVGKFVAEDLSPYVLACGLTGFLAYIGLELAAERRIRQAAAAEERSMARRLDRHVVQNQFDEPVGAVAGSQGRR